MTLDLRLLGPFQARWDDQPIAPISERGQAILVCLVLDGPRTRRVLAERIWGPDRLRNLRQELYRLKKLPGSAAWLVLERDRVELRATSDLQRAREALESGNLPAGTGLLEGWEGPSPAFAEWLDGHREAWAQSCEELALDGPDRLARVLLLAEEAGATPGLPVLAAMVGVSEPVALGWLAELPHDEGRLRGGIRGATARRLSPTVRRTLSAALLDHLSDAPARARARLASWAERADASDLWTAVAVDGDRAAFPRALEHAATPEAEARVYAAWLAALRGEDASSVRTRLAERALVTQAPALLRVAASDRALQALATDPPQALESAEEALRIATRHGEPSDRVQARVLLAEVLRQLGEPVRAGALFQAAALDPGASVAARITSLNGAGAAAAMQGLPHEALHLHQEALGLAREAGDRTGIARLLNSVGTDLERLGRYQEAATTFREGAALALSLGQPQVWAMARRNAALCFLRAGRLALARDDLQSLAEHTSIPGPLVWRVHAEMERVLGRLAAARAWIERVLEEEPGDWSELTLATLALQDGRPALDRWVALYDRHLAAGDSYLAAEHAVEMALWTRDDACCREALARYPFPEPVNPRHVLILALATARAGTPDPLLRLPDLPTALRAAPRGAAAVRAFTWLAATGAPDAEAHRERLLLAMGSGLPASDRRDLAAALSRP